MCRFEWEPKDNVSCFMKAGGFELQDVRINLVFLHKACWCTAQPNWSFLSDLSAPLPLQCRSWMFNGNVGCFGARQTRFAAWQKHMNWKAERCCKHRKSQQPAMSKQPSAQEKLCEYRLHFLFRSSTGTHMIALFNFGSLSDLTLCSLVYCISYMGYNGFTCVCE